MNRHSLILYLMAILAMSTIPASARIKLAALPDRAAAIVRLDNPAFTLVEEERVLTLQKGVNEVDFSWKGVAIDPDSIRLAVMDPKDKIVLLNVSYPPNEGALVWQLSAPQAFNARARISYLLQNIDRLVTYKGVAEQDESKLDLESYLILRNFSGEDFDSTKILLDYGQAFEKSVKNEETKQLLFFQKPGLPIQKTFKWNAREKPWDPKLAHGKRRHPAVLHALQHGRKRPRRKRAVGRQGARVPERRPRLDHLSRRGHRRASCRSATRWNSISATAGTSSSPRRK